MVSRRKTNVTIKSNPTKNLERAEVGSLIGVSYHSTIVLIMQNTMMQ